MQATKPITSRVEMRGDAYPGTNEEASLAAMDSVAARLLSIPEYVARFEAAFPEEAAAYESGIRPILIDAATFGRAIDAFERELVTVKSPYDRFVDGDENALSDSKKRGLVLFFTKAGCAACHNGPMFSDYSFSVNGVPHVGPGKDLIPGDNAGREEHTLNPDDRFAFRTPTLRNVEITAPYMHGGQFSTLEGVVRLYNYGCQPRHPDISNEMMDALLVGPLNLTNQEIQNIVSFMKSLIDPGSSLPDYLRSIPEAVPSGLPPVFGISNPGS